MTRLVKRSDPVYSILELSLDEMVTIRLALHTYAERIQKETKADSLVSRRSDFITDDSEQYGVRRAREINDLLDKLKEPA